MDLYVIFLLLINDSYTVILSLIILAESVSLASTGDIQPSAEGMSLAITDNLQPLANKQLDIKENKWKALFGNLRRDKEYRGKIIKTGILCWSFVNYGIIIGQFGPSLLDLSEITNTTLSQISATITASGIGYLLGALVTGIIGNRIHIDFLCFLSGLFSSVFVTVIPWCSVFEIMVLMKLLRSSMGGVLDTAANALLVELWGKESSSYMQALHFSWALGSIVSPLFTAPFLSKLTNNTISFNISNITCQEQIEKFGSSSNESFCQWNNTDEIFNTTSRFNEISRSEFKLYIPYSIAGFLNMTAAICFLVMYIQSLSLKTRKIDNKNYKIEINQSKNRSIKFSSSREAILPKVGLLNMILLIMIYVSLEGIFGALLTTYSVTKLGWTKVDGSYITSVFAGCLCVGRLFSVYVIKFLGSSKILLVYGTILCVSLAGFLISSVFKFQVGIWLTTAVAGLSGSAMFPGILTWTQEDFVPMTRRVTSSIMVGSSIGWMSAPTIVGILMDTVSPMYFCYVSLGVSMVVICLYSTAYLLSRELKKYTKTSINVTYVV